jgi:hypothetical protein
MEVEENEKLKKKSNLEVLGQRGAFLIIVSNFIFLNNGARKIIKAFIII